MSPLPGNEYLHRLSDALVSEIKAEMGRRDMSARGLAGKIGENPQYVTSRILSGNPRTGKRVELTVSDLARIGGVFDIEPAELYRRAVAAVDMVHPSEHGVVIEADFGNQSDAGDSVAPVRSERTAAKKRNKRGEDDAEHTP